VLADVIAQQPAVFRGRSRQERRAEAGREFRLDADVRAAAPEVRLAAE
jgi:hypothetical protein